jgi:tetratricopeptide (TPR) repeat protein
MRTCLALIGAALSALASASPQPFPTALPPPVPESVTVVASPSEQDDQALWAEADRRYRAAFFYCNYLLADMSGHSDASLVFLKRATEADPGSLLLLKELASQYEMRQQMGEAAAALKQALALQPEDADLRQKLARYFIRAGKNDDARGLFLKPDGQEPDDVASLRALAALDMAENKWADAEKRLARLVQLHPQAKDEREMYADVLVHLEKNDDAVAQYQALLKDDPGRAETAYRLSHLYETLGKKDEAIQALKDALAAAPDSALLQDALARAYYRQEKYDDAEKGFSQLIQANGQDTDSLLFRGMSRLQAKKYKEAQEDFQKLGEMDAGNPSQLYGLGLAQLWQGKRDEAEGTFKKLVEAHPSAVAGYTQLAFIYDKTSRTAEAVGLLERGVKENPESVELYLLLGSAQLDLGQPKKAEKVFVDGIKATGNSTALRFQLAVLYDQNGKFADAESELKAIIDIEPSNAQALNYLGYSWIDRDKNLQEGEALIRRALKVEPDNHYYQDSLGWACYKQGRYDEAKAALIQAVSQPNDSPEEWIVFEHLGKVYEKLGDSKNAQVNFDKSKQLKQGQN